MLVMWDGGCGFGEVVVVVCVGSCVVVVVWVGGNVCGGLFRWLVSGYAVGGYCCRWL